MRCVPLCADESGSRVDIRDIRDARSVRIMWMTWSGAFDIFILLLISRLVWCVESSLVPGKSWCLSQAERIQGSNTRTGSVLNCLSVQLTPFTHHGTLKFQTKWVKKTNEVMTPLHCLGFSKMSIYLLFAFTTVTSASYGSMLALCTKCSDMYSVGLHSAHIHKIKC